MYLYRKTGQGSALNGDKVQIVIEAEGRADASARRRCFEGFGTCQQGTGRLLSEKQNFGFVIPDDQKIAKDISFLRAVI